jgi:hypothetical protein
MKNGEANIHMHINHTTYNSQSMTLDREIMERERERKIVREMKEETRMGRREMTCVCVRVCLCVSKEWPKVRSEKKKKRILQKNQDKRDGRKPLLFLKSERR